MSVKQLFAPIAADMQAVDAVIRSRLHSDVDLIRRVAEYIVQSGGKRLRPALVLFTAGAMGYRGTHHHELAAVVEFIHTATLLHDDVVDESTLRRGRATANQTFGNPASVLVGDFLYSRAFQMMVESHSMRVMQVLADATNVIAEGEVLQLLNCHNADVVIDDYLRVIRYKTAKLFEAAARLGGIVGGADVALEARLAAFGMHLGTAFQLIDDVLDYSADEADTGKHLGDDLRGQTDAAPDPRHAARHGRAGGLGPGRDREWRSRGFRRRARGDPAHRRARGDAPLRASRGGTRHRRDFRAAPFQFQGSVATIIGLCSSAKTLI